MADHSNIVGGSTAKRVIACPGSVALVQKMPPKPSIVYADTGTLLHDAMAQILQANPNLWGVAGDLFVKNMDWPGAQEIAKRLAKTIDPKLPSDPAEDPALKAANQQIEAMGAEMDQMFQMLQNVSRSMEATELRIKEYEAQVKAYDAETKRISAVQSGLNEEQIQDIVMGTISGMMSTGDLMPPEVPREAPGMGEEMV